MKYTQIFPKIEKYNNTWFILMKEMYRVYKNIEWMNSLEWWHIISEKRCDNYAHSQEDEHNEALKDFLQ